MVKSNSPSNEGSTISRRRDRESQTYLQIHPLWMYGRKIFERLRSKSQPISGAQSTDWFVSDDRGLGALLPVMTMTFFFIDVFSSLLKKRYNLKPKDKMITWDNRCGYFSFT